MIPKIIHYCWFGRGEKNPLIQACIASWRKYLPDYRIVEWNEDSFDVYSTLWTRQAYAAKKWAFVSDYVRLHALYREGGLYLDTDVEVLRPLDDFLDNALFTGYEANDFIMTAVMGAEAGNPVIRQLLAYYDSRPFVNEDGSFHMLPNPYIVTEFFRKAGIRPNGREQKTEHLHIYPQIYFSPNNLTRIWEKPSPKSYTIHHFDQSWSADKKDTVSVKGRVRRYLIGVLRNAFGTEALYNAKDKTLSALRRKRS